MGQARIRRLAGDTHEARRERTPTAQRILELVPAVQARVGTDAIEFALQGSGRCWLWATSAQDVLDEHGIESRIVRGAAVASFGSGELDAMDFGFTAGGCHYWLALADGTVIDFSAADFPIQRRSAHLAMPMSDAAMSCEIPAVFDSRTGSRLRSPTDTSSGFAMFFVDRGDGYRARLDVQEYRDMVSA